MIECTSATNCLVDGIMPAQFDGHPVEAEGAGWEENEYGWVCPECREEDHSTIERDEDEVCGALSLSDSDGEDIGELMVAAAAHASVDRLEFAKQAVRAGMDKTGAVNVALVQEYINHTFAKGHRAEVKKLVSDALPLVRKEFGL